MFSNYTEIKSETSKRNVSLKISKYLEIEQHTFKQAISPRVIFLIFELNEKIEFIKIYGIQQNQCLEANL